MKCVVGIDLGSTTTKAVLFDEDGKVVGRGITNSRSDYGVAAAVAREEALTATRFELLERALQELGSGDPEGLREDLANPLKEAFRLEIYLDQLIELRREILDLLSARWMADSAPTWWRRRARRSWMSGC